MSETFDDRVVVRSPATQVDTDALAATCVRLRTVVDTLAQALTHLSYARDQCSASQAGIGCGSGNICLLASLEEAIRSGEYLRQELDEHVTNLGYAAVVLAAADKDAAGFASVYRTVGLGEPPSRFALPPLLRAPLGRPVGPFYDLGNPPSVFSPEPSTPRKGTSFLPPLLPAIDKQILWAFGAGSLWARHVREFIDGSGDGTLGPRLQSDLALAAQHVRDAERSQMWQGAGGIAPFFLQRKHVKGAEDQGKDLRAVTAFLAVNARTWGQWDPLHHTKIHVHEITDSANAGQVTTPPRSSAQALERILSHEAQKDEGRIEILEHVHEDGTRSWSVIAWGTRNWAIDSTNPHDLVTNLESVARVKSDQHEAIRKAMELAAIKPGEPVELIGHSQAGIVMSDLAGDTEFLERFTVVSVLSAGSPVGNRPIGQGVRRLCLENTRDIVPALDGVEANTQRGQRTVSVHFDGALLNLTDTRGKPLNGHMVEVYSAALGALTDPRSSVAPEVRAWEHARNDALGLDEQTRTRAHQFATRRDPGAGFFGPAKDVDHTLHTVP